MRLVIDLQGAQSESRGRGIGRYSRSLALAMAAQAGPHEVTVALNGGFEEATAELRDAFAPILPRGQIKVWYGPGQQTGGLAEDAARRRAAERIRAAFLADLQPDLLLLASVFEGFGDDAVTTMPVDRAGPPTVSICYDLIPLLRPDTYLQDPARRRFYYRALLELQHSVGLLAISASTQAETESGLALPPGRVANIMAGVEPHFRRSAEGDEPQAAVLARYGLQSGYVLCVGAVEQRKNLTGLIKAYAMLPQSLRRLHPLVATGWNDAELLPPLRRASREAGLGSEELHLLTDFVPDRDLPALYRGSAVAVSPSLHEGFGLSVAEAMACGAAVICSNRSSLPEVIGRPDATFDPLRPESIAERMRAVLERPALRDDLRRHGLARAGLFTWPRTARRAWDALEQLAPPERPQGRAGQRRKPSLAVVTPVGDGTAALLAMLVRLSHAYSVTLVSDDPAPDDPMLAATFPVQPPGHLAGSAPDRLVFLPGDDPQHMALTLRLSFGFAGIVVAGPRPAAAILAEGVGTETASLLTECLLDSYGWGAAVAAREGLPELAGRYPLEPMLRARSVALLEAGTSLTADLIERCYADNPRAAAEACAADLAAAGAASPETARALAATFAEQRPRGLYLDVTTLAVFDAGTGIQRVVREITHQLGHAHDVAARVEPVRSTKGVVTLARQFGRSLYGVPDASAEPLPATFGPGDVYLCLDLNVHDRSGMSRTMYAVRAGGGRAVVVIYDLLPVLTPHYFPETVQRAFPIWLDLIASEADALLCISRTVADELLDWLARNRPARNRPLDIGWFHLGSDFNAVATTPAAPGRPELLMVGTVEPRKGHAEALDAMEQVWRSGADVGLVIAGRAGWHTEALQARLHAHPEAGRRLQWLASADDAQVSALYRRAGALLMASEGEGFGLPIVEAAHAGLPVIARDIPVFREICGDSALLFAPGKLAETIQHWMALHEEGRVPDPAGILAISWSEASRRVAKIVLEDDWYARWPAAG